MKTGFGTVTVLVVAIFLAAPVLADDVEDVKAAVQRYMAAVNAADADAAIQHRSQAYNTFGRGGWVLGETRLL